MVETQTRISWPLFAAVASVAIVAAVVPLTHSVDVVAVFSSALVSSIVGFAFSPLCGAFLFHTGEAPVRVVQILFVSSIAVQSVSPRRAASSRPVADTGAVLRRRRVRVTARALRALPRRHRDVRARDGILPHLLWRVYVLSSHDARPSGSPWQLRRRRVRRISGRYHGRRGGISRSVRYDLVRATRLRQSPTARNHPAVYLRHADRSAARNDQHRTAARSLRRYGHDGLAHSPGGAMSGAYLGLCRFVSSPIDSSSGSSSISSSSLPGRGFIA